MKDLKSFDEFIFTDKWRAGFRSLQSKVANGERDYLSMDEIHMEVLIELLNELEIKTKGETDGKTINK